MESVSLENKAFNKCKSQVMHYIQNLDMTGMDRVMVRDSIHKFVQGLEYLG